MPEPFRVLVVDDDETSRKLVARALSGAGCRVDEVASGEEALHRTQSRRGGYDVAVIDQRMGPPNGLEIMQQIQRLYPSIEVIILTGYAERDTGERAIALGAYRYMWKPFEPEELILNIRTAARFGQERQRRLALENLLQAGQKLSGAQTEQELYQRIFEQTQALLPGLDTFIVSEWDQLNQTVSFPFCQVRDESPSLQPRKGHHGITEYVIETREPLLLSQGDEAFRRERRLEPPRVGCYCASEIAVPIFRQEKVIGTISALAYSDGVHYAPAHVEVLQAMANQAAAALQSLRQLEESNQLREAVARLASEAGVEDVLRAIVREAQWLIGADLTGLILQNEDGVLYRSRPTIPEDGFDKFGEPRQRGGVTRAVVESRRTTIIEDTLLEPLVKQSARDAGIRSMLAIPLAHGERVLGVAYAHWYRLRRLSSHEVSLWNTFATNAADALHSAQEETRQVEDATRLARELGTLTEKMSLNEAMVRVATVAKTVFRADTCHLALVDPPTGHILGWAWAEGDPLEDRCEDHPREKGVTNYVLTHRKPVFCSDARGPEEPQAVPSLVERGLKSFAALYLECGGRSIAVLHLCYFRRQRVFGKRDEALLKVFAAPAAMALDRARRDKREDIWRDVYQQIATLPDPRAVYRCFVEHVQRAFDADLVFYYPCRPLPTLTQSNLTGEEVVYAGELREPLQPPRGGQPGGVIQALAEARDGLLIVPDMQAPGCRLQSSVATREGVKAYVAMRLEVMGDDQLPRTTAVLFVDFRKPAALQRSDLIGLQLAGNRVAAAIQKLYLQRNLQQQWERQNRLLQAVVDIFQAFRTREEGRIVPQRIVEAARDVLGLHACSLFEYEPQHDRFVERGTAGLARAAAGRLLSGTLKPRFMNRPGPHVIPDARQEPLLRQSGLFGRRSAHTVIVHPLRPDGDGLGLLLAGHPKARVLEREESEALALFASLAALALGETRLRQELRWTQERLARRAGLTWMRVMDSSVLHSLGQKAAAMRFDVAVLQRRLDQIGAPEAVQDARVKAANIDRLATEIANTPLHLPQSWELQRVFVPLASLVKEVAEREGKPLAQLENPVTIQSHVDALGGAQVYACPRGLIYALENMIKNAQHAMPHGGDIVIEGWLAHGWAELRIHDSGGGVPENIRDKLFHEPIPRTADGTGSGLGALLAAILVEESGGSAALESTGPQGSTVLVRLPVVGIEEQAKT